MTKEKVLIAFLWGILIGAFVPLLILLPRNPTNDAKNVAGFMIIILLAIAVIFISSRIKQKFSAWVG